MFKILLIIIFLFVFVGGLFGFSISRMLFGRPNQSHGNQRKTTSQQTQSNKKGAKSQASQTKKIITKDEGEYVDFEEIKD